MSIKIDPRIVGKWERAKGALSVSDISDPIVKQNMSQLLENQYHEQTTGGIGLLTEDAVGIGTNFADGDGIAIGAKPDYNMPASGPKLGALAPLSFAVLRRTFPALFANKVVGVQAMTGPTGMALALRYVYNKTDVEAGWDKVPQYAGYTGNYNGITGLTGVPATSAAISAAYGAQDAQLAEAWKLGGTSASEGPVTDPAKNEYPELSFQVERQAILAQSRKLASSFSLEAIADAKAVLNLDLEKEIVGYIQYELIAEQDRELLWRMKRAAVTTGFMPTPNAEYGYGSSIPSYSVINGGVAGLSLDLTTSTEARWQQEQISVLVTFILGLANNIATATRRGAGNFCVVSPAVATLLQAAGPIWNRTPTNVNGLDAVPEIGTIADNIKVYRDQYATEDYVLVGYKGPSTSDAGIIYSPYVTALTSRAIAADNFAPRIGVMSRYAVTDSLLGAGRYYRYAKVTVPTSLSGIAAAPYGA